MGCRNIWIITARAQQRRRSSSNSMATIISIFSNGAYNHYVLLLYFLVPVI